MDTCYCERVDDCVRDVLTIVCADIVWGIPSIRKAFVRAGGQNRFDEEQPRQ